MTLTRPQAGQPLSNPSGPAVMDEYADAIEQAQADIVAAQADIAVLESTTSSNGSPDVVYADAFPDVAAVTLHSCDSLSDGTGVWVGSGLTSGSSLALDTTNKTSGTASVSTSLNYPGGGGTDGKMYCNLAASIPTTGHLSLNIDVRFTKNGGATTQNNFEIVFASALDLGGTVITQSFSGSENLWKTFTINVGALTQVRSFGIRKKASATSGGGSGVNTIFKIDTPRLADTSALDAAFATPDRAVIVPSSFVETVPQGTRTLSSTQSLLDLRQTDANITRFRRVHSLRDRLIDETGTVDVTNDLQAFFNSLQPGDLLTAPPGAKYRMDGHIDFTSPYVTVDMQGAAFFATAARNVGSGDPSMFSIQADYVTLRNWRVFGKAPNQTHTGANLTNVAGAPTTVIAGTKQLNSINDEVRVPVQSGQSDNGKTHRYGRDEDGYIQFDITLSQASPVASDCVVTILDHAGTEVQYTTTITPLTSTATVYTVKFRPLDLFARTRVQVKKTKAGSPIVVHSITGYRRVDYRASGNADLDYSQNSGLLIAGANYCTIENYVGEGMAGDSIQCRAGSGVRINGHLARATGRENFVLTHGVDGEVRNFVWCGGARDTIDIEPETGTVLKIDGFIFKNGIIGTSWNVAVVASGADRGTGIVFEDVVVRNDIGGVWDTDMNNAVIRNVTYINERTDGVLADIDIGGDSNIIENLVSDAPVIIRSADAVVKGCWVKHVVQDTGSFIVTGANADVQDIRVGDPANPYTIDTSVTSFNPVQLAVDTTYRNIEVPVWKTEFGNTYKANAATQMDWLPRGLDLRQSGARQVRGLSATTTPANNLRGIAQAVTAAATTATVAFPARTDVMQLPATALTASGPHVIKLTADDTVDAGSWYGAYSGQDTRKAITGATYVLGTPWTTGDPGKATDHPFPRGIVTFTTSTPHDLLVGDKVGVSGMANDVYNSSHDENDPGAHNTDSWEYVVVSVPTTTTWTAKLTWADPGAPGGAGVMAFGPTATNAHVQRWLRALSTLADPDITVTGNGLPFPGGSGGLTLTWGASLGDLPDTLFSAVSIDLTDYKQREQTIKSTTSVIGGFVVSNQWYVYRTAGRTFEGQPLAGRTAVKVFLSSGTNAITVGTGGGNLLYSTASDLAVAGLTVWRAGPFASDPGTYTGSYTKRADLVGVTDFHHPTSATDRETSIGGIPWTTVSVTSAELDTNQSGWEPDTAYGVWVTPSWPTPVAITTKRTGGFDITFGVACPTGGGTFDWGLVR